MCYRYSNLDEETRFRKSTKRYLKNFRIESVNGPFSFIHSNGFSHEKLPTITMECPEDITYMHWGLIPFFTKTKEDKETLWKRGYTLNARGEEIFTKPSFRGPIKDKRCLIPATGFFEWRNYNGIKYPYLVQLINPDFEDDTTPFCFAGVYDRWVDKTTGELIEGFAIVTTAANSLMKRIHVNIDRPDEGGRQPVIVLPNDYENWLSPNATFENLERIIEPVQSEIIRAYTITKDITRRGFDLTNPSLLSHVSYDNLPGCTFNIPNL